MKYSPELQDKFEKYADILRDWQSRINLVAPSTLNDIQHRHIDDSAQLHDVIKGFGTGDWGLGTGVVQAESPFSKQKAPTPNTPQSLVTIVDLGSGAGFPAVVLAIMGWRVVAIESIAKKCRFLEELKIQLNLPNLTVVNDRVEKIIPSLAERGGCAGLRAGGRVENKSDRPGLPVPNTTQSPVPSPQPQVPIFTARAFAPMVKIMDYTQPRPKVVNKATMYLLKGANVAEEIREAKKKYKFDCRLFPSKTGDGFIAKIENIKYKS